MSGNGPRIINEMIRCRVCGRQISQSGVPNICTNCGGTAERVSTVPAKSLGSVWCEGLFQACPACQEQWIPVGKIEILNNPVIPLGFFFACVCGAEWGMQWGENGEWPMPEMDQGAAP